MELDGIARAGGGICDIIPLAPAGYSVQMVTRQSIPDDYRKGGKPSAAENNRLLDGGYPAGLQG